MEAEMNTTYVSYKKMMTSLGVVLTLGTTACSKSASFSLLSDSNNFQQNSSETNGKIDVLYVIDNSGSMASSQTNLSNNFASFIAEFDAKGFDYQIAVTTTDSYKALYDTNPTTAAAKAKFRDGLNSHTGVFVITPNTPDVINTFRTNMAQGTSGNGDERAFQSMQAALTAQVNIDLGFPREDAFLSVIIVSDEDDFSRASSSSTDGTNHVYTNTYPVSDYVSFLDGYMGADASTRSSKYNVNSITIPDQACMNQIGGNAQIIGTRYVQLSNQTNGIVGSICSNFGPTLANISAKIIELVTQFYLNRLPVESTLEVFVNGVSITKLSSSAGNGFLYHADTNSITFHGTAVPGPGASIQVKFDPTSIR